MIRCPFHYAQAFSELAKVKILLEALIVTFSGTNKKSPIPLELPELHSLTSRPLVFGAQPTIRGTDPRTRRPARPVLAPIRLAALVPAPLLTRTSLPLAACRSPRGSCRLPHTVTRAGESLASPEAYGISFISFMSVSPTTPRPEADGA